jgi:beta-glucosidase
MGWEVQPPALRRLLVRLHQDYSKYELPPMYITENGAAFKDEVSADGNVHDPRRENFVREHLKECSLAINDGVDLRGYFVWSFLDNFEWAYGFEKRFGIVRVDYPTQKRIIKDSGNWYSKVIAANKVEMPLKEAVR